MPISLPNLDDRRYDDLVREAMELIPVIAPSWTNHNASDPGITLVEMLAYLVEILIYRTNRIGDPQLAVFVSLLTGLPPHKDLALPEQIRNAVVEIRHRTGVVTADDYENQTMACAPGRLARVHCVPGSNLAIKVGDPRRPGHVSVIVVPETSTPDTSKKEKHPRPTPELLAAIRNSLEDYRPVTTRLHVVGPLYVPVAVVATLVPVAKAPERETANHVKEALERFFAVLPDPARGENGWPFGSDIYISEIYDAIERVPGVDYVATLGLVPEDQSRILRNAKGETVGVRLSEHELPIVDIKDVQTEIPSKALDESSGTGGGIHAR